MSASNGISQNESQMKDIVLRNLSILNQLTLETFSLESQKKLIFHILNKTVVFCSYSRAILFKPGSNKIFGISGTSKFEKHSQAVYQWQNIAKSIVDKDKSCIISEETVADKSLYSNYNEGNNGTSACWLPLIYKEHSYGALLLERWDGKEWREPDLKGLAPITNAYAIALSKFISKKSYSGKRILKTFILFLILACLVVGYNIPIPYRIVAPCEVIPEDPYPITAETNGVIKAVLIKPGDDVSKGQHLISYDKEVIEQELKTYEQEIYKTREDYNRAEVQSINNSMAKSEINLILNKFEQDKIRYNMVRSKLNKMDLYAPDAGVVIMPDYEKWEGKPVVVGERIMQIADPDKTKLRIGIPVNERLKFDDDLEVKIVLNSDATSSYSARLSYVDIYSTLSETGISEYLAEAEWDSEVSGVSIGMKGTAFIHGDKIKLGNWLLRRPIAAVRRFFGW